MKTVKILFCLSFIGNCIPFSSDAQVLSTGLKIPCIPCEQLKTLDWPDLTISDATIMDAKTPHCKVTGTIGKEINFELLLPMEWNGRFVMGGGGGFVGAVQNVAQSQVNEGFATVGTDTGHKGHGMKADWALLNIERQINFGYLAIHRTAIVSKALISHFYGSPPGYSYFIGGSRGGGQAMIEAQRYPDDFDGIVAGCPVIDWPATTAEFIQNMQVLYPNPSNLTEPMFSKEHLVLLQDEVLKQCDEIDGLKDQILNDPRNCNFDFSKLPKCKKDNEGNDCFTSRQINALKIVYGALENEEEIIYPGFPFGCEAESNGWLLWVFGTKEAAEKTGFPSAQFGFGTELFKYFIFHDPDWDYSKYDFSSYFDDTRFASSFLNATSTDYSKFKNRGSKMIIYHGWNDPGLSAYTAIEHYEKAKAKDAEIENYLRLFLLPGVLHCGGGSGPDHADWFSLIRDWVENDNPPEKVILSKMQDGKVVMTRPVFPYPGIAKYNGNGDPDVESSFESSETGEIFK